MIRVVRRLLALVGAACALACTPLQYYAAPPELTAESAATVVGSQVETPGILAADLVAFVPAIDGAYTRLGRFDWNRPLLVPPGERTVRISVIRGDRGAIAEPRATLENGRTYVARARQLDRQSLLIWLEDQGTGAVVGDRFVKPIVVYRALY